MVGQLTQPLAAGPLDRWDETHAVVVRLEGGAPTSAAADVVLAGANLMAIESGVGWELVQYRQATLLGGGVWRLSGLLRGRQGTEVEMSSGAVEGAIVVLLNPSNGRFETAISERGLSRIARIGPTGRAPGGAGFTEIAFTPMRLHDRPWSPTGLKVSDEAGGLTLTWIPRVRIGGDVWDLEPAPVDPSRFRVQVMEGETERRVIETSGPSFLYSTAEIDADFPGGPGPDVWLAVAQYGAGFGWGVEATTSLAA